MLILCHRAHYVDREPIGGRHIDSDELYSHLHQSRDEEDVAGETIQLRNHQRGLEPLALCQRCE